jgi:ATP-dependent helicase HrpA
MKFIYPPDLPISQRREEILTVLRAHPVVIIAGETGSGKTTQLPKMCLEAGWAEHGRIACTQPRRVAAMSLSRRVAEELQVPWGKQVGCKMRFNDDTSRETVLKFVTDGILLTEIQSDPQLRQYSAIIIDEAHERSLNIDFLLGYLIRLRQQRPDLKIIVTSATIDTQAFSEAFGGAPIIEVSGRIYPVELRWWPIQSAPEDDGFVEETCRAVEDCLMEGSGGDVLVFFPTERDIREARDTLEGRCGKGCEVLPLFGRMSGADQQRVFSPGAKRRVVLSTNIAETSVTIPRIRYVIDTGVARMSRYNPRTRTKRLPVEPVSQSSANQRQGRAGRVQDGICVRLFSEEDFAERPRFTQPEIQRANLAEVILRMKAFKLGDIEEFPFLSPPTGVAVRAGYTLLHELGAIDEEYRLTSLGRDLARLPVDPTIGRMLLQAKEERSLPELCVIAAGLSIPDPRERPQEAREAADAAHKNFSHPESDFLSLLKIWIAAPQDGGSRNALRRFCQQNFISMVRFKEWRDIHSQLVDMLVDDSQPLAAPELPTDAVMFRSIHRAIVAGLPSQLGFKDEKERNCYKTSGDRKVLVFPGSSLHERPKNRKQAAEKSRQPEWIIAGEIVQTSQLFARTLAKIDPTWLIETAPHLCQYRFRDPMWDEKSQRVLATERTMLYGLELRRRRIDFGKVDPGKAKEIFIRDYLLSEERDLPVPFFQKNQDLRHKLETALATTRNNRVFAISEALYAFYHRELPANISSVADFNKALHEGQRSNPHYLIATEQDLSGGAEVSWDAEAFPDTVALDNTVLPLEYAYKPGDEKDGVTIKVPLPAAPLLTSSQVLWLVPGLRSELIAHLLRELPKNLRRQLLPIDDKVPEIVREFRPAVGDFFVELALHLRRRYRLEISAADWPTDVLPPHLQPRLNVVDSKDKTVVAARDLKEIKKLAEAAKPKTDAWIMLTERVEKFGLLAWVIGDLPQEMEVEKIAGVPVHAYPGLMLRQGDVDLKIFRKPEERAKFTPPAIRSLAEMALAKDLAWLRKELGNFRVHTVAQAAGKQAGGMANALQGWSSQQTATNKLVWCPPDVLQASAVEHVCAHLLRLEPLLPLTAKRFEDLIAQSRKSLPGLLARVREQCAAIFTLRDQVLSSQKTYAGLARDVERLVPANFLAITPHRQLNHLPRYLKAIQVRAERASLHPAKDAEKASRLEDFAYWEQDVPIVHHDTFRWMLEEYRVSIFAPELGTAQPVSEKRLLALLQDG